MATPILRGTDEPQLQNFEIQFDPNTGTIVSKEYKGINYDKMAVLAQSYGANRWKGTLRSEFGIATLKLTGTSPSGGTGGGSSPVNDITDKWEISVDQEKPDLCENWYYRSLFQTADAAYAGAAGMPNPISEQFSSVLRSVANGENKTRAALREKLKATNLVNASGEDVEFGGQNKVSLFDIFAGFLSGLDVVNFVDDYLRGANTFVRGKYVLRHVTNAPSDYSENVADWGVESIYTISQLLSEAEDSGLWILPLPGYLAYKILNAPAPTYLPSNYQWGALKLRSSATTAALGRVEIATEYLIDAWPIHTYGLL